MKKFFAIAFIATAFVACNNSADKKETKDTTVIKVDSPVIKIDSPVIKIDSPAVKVDTPAAKM